MRVLFLQMLGVSFAEDGSYFVTVGSRRVRFWYFDTTGRDGRVRRRVGVALGTVC